MKDLTKAGLVNISIPGSWGGRCPIDNRCQFLGHKYSHTGQFQATNRILADLKTSWRCSYGEGNGNPFQCSCLENPRDGGAWWAAVYGVAQNRTRLKWLSSSSSSSSSTAFNPVTFHLAQHYLACCWLLKSAGFQGLCLFCLHRVCTSSPWTSSWWTECVKCSVKASGDFGNIRSLRLLTESTLSSLSGM